MDNWKTMGKTMRKLRTWMGTKIKHERNWTGNHGFFPMKFIRVSCDVSLKPNRWMGKHESTDSRVGRVLDDVDQWTINPWCLFASNDGVFDRENMGNYGKINLNYPYQKLYTNKPLEFRSTPILDKSIQIDMRMTSLIVKGLNLVTHPDNWTQIWTSPFLMGEIMYRCAIHSYVKCLITRR